jgi:uncharacterized protein YndB with AHSA1/START domain
VLNRAIRVARGFAATPERVFAAWIDARIARRWLFATATRPLARVAIDARAGGSFRCTDDRGVEHAGDYLELDAPRRLVFTLCLACELRTVTRVSVEITPSRARCMLALVHAGVPRACAREVGDRWRGMLYGLEATLASAPVVPRRIPSTARQLPIPAWRTAP